MRCSNRRTRRLAWLCLAGVAAWAFAVPAWAQSTLGMSSGGGSLGLGSSSGLGSSGGLGLGASGGLGRTGTSGGNLGLGGNTGGFASSTGFGTGGTSFSGGGGFQGGSRSGTYGSGTTGGTFFPTPSQSNPFAQYYRSPLTLSNTSSTNGLVTIQQMPLGQPMYAIVTTTNATSSGMTIRTPGSTTGFGSPAYGGGAAGSGVPATAAGPNDLIIGRVSLPSSVQADVQGVLARTNGLSAGKNIQVATVGSVLVLRGRVASEHDRRLAENLARLSPGVYEVRNELQVGAARTASTGRP